MKSAAIKENSFHITYLIYSFRWHTMAFTLSKVLLVSEHGEWKGGTLISLLDRQNCSDRRFLLSHDLNKEDKKLARTLSLALQYYKTS